MQLTAGAHNSHAGPSAGEHPNVAVILLNWNGWSDTVECLRALEGLDYLNHHVVVVDNGSTNDSLIRIREAFPTVMLLETGANLGFSGGNNLGILYGLDHGADYVWVLNNDTCPDPDALSAMVAVAESDPKVGAVGSVLYYMDEPSRVQAWGGGKVYMWTGTSRHFTEVVSSEKLDYISGASLLLRREVLERVGLLDDGFFMYWEDTDISFRLRKAGWRLSVAPDARVLHKESASLGTKSPVLDRYFNASAVRFFNRHSTIFVISTYVGILGRLLKRLLRGDWQRVRAVWQGWRTGLTRRA